MVFQEHDLSDSSRKLLKEAREFTREVLEPAESLLDALENPEDVYKHPLYQETVSQAFSRGYHKITMPEKFGGLGRSRLDYFMLCEEMAVGAPGISSQFLNASTAAALISGYKLYEKSDLYRAYLEAYVSDTRGVHTAAWGATEPSHGSDIFNHGEEFGRLKTTARETDDGYVIDGEKSQYVGNGYLADYVLLMAALVGKDGAFKGHAAFLFPLDLPGVSRGKPLDRVGMRVANQAALYFKNVRVPAEFLIVQPDGYAQFFNSFVTVGNTVVGLTAAGLARSSFEAGLEHAKTRSQGGKKLIEHQLVSMRLFESYRLIEDARSTLWRSSHAIADKRPNTLLSIAARVSASKAAMTVTQEIAQLNGASAIVRHSGRIERHFRDARLLAYADGTIDRVSLTAAAFLK